MKDDYSPKDTLESLLVTITNYDSKAGTLLTAVGVTFGFSLFSIGEIINKTGPIKTAIYVLGILYIVSFLSCIITLSLIVFPRRRTRKEDEYKIEYPLDLGDLFRHLKDGDLDDFLSKGYDKEAIVDQIKVCTRITITKETLLRIFAVLIIVFSAFLVSLLVCLFI